MLNDRHTNLSRMLNAPVKPPSLQESLQRQRRPQPQPIVPGMPSTPAPSVPTPTGYNPRKEQLFASLLGQGMRPVGSMGSHWEGIGNLAKVIAGSIGGARQDKAKQEEISRFEAGEAEKEQAKRADYGRLATLVGLPPEQAALAARNPDFIDPLVQANQPQADPLAKPFSQPMERYNPETGERELAMNPGDMQQLYARGFTDEVPEPVEPEYGRYMGPDGQAIHATLEQAREQNLQPLDEFQVNRQFDAQQAARASGGDGADIRMIDGLPHVMAGGQYVPVPIAGQEDGAIEPPDLSESQQKTLQFATVGTDALGVLNSESPDGRRYYDVLSDPIVQAAALGGKSFFSKVIMGGIEYTLSPEQRRAAAAANTLVNATLRRESGAAISDEEATRKWGELIPASRSPEDVTEDKWRRNLATFNTMWYTLPSYFRPENMANRPGIVEQSFGAAPQPAPQPAAQPIPGAPAPEDAPPGPPPLPGTPGPDEPTGYENLSVDQIMEASARDPELQAYLTGSAAAPPAQVAPPQQRSRADYMQSANRRLNPGQRPSNWFTNMIGDQASLIRQRLGQ